MKFQLGDRVRIEGSEIIGVITHLWFEGIGTRKTWVILQTNNGTELKVPTEKLLK